MSCNHANITNEPKGTVASIKGITEYHSISKVRLSQSAAYYITMMLTTILVLFLGMLARAFGATYVSVPAEMPQDVSHKVQSGFVSYSIELSWLPDYAGENESFVKISSLD